MIVVPFDPSHLIELRLQNAQQHLGGEILKPEYAQAVDIPANAFTGMSDGQPVVCSGIVPIWENRALAWALFSPNAGAHMVKIVAAIRRFLDATEYRRVEAYTECDFVQGNRMLSLLGFKLEGKAAAYTPSGADVFLYGRVRA
jgi:hypothetical protein